MKILTLIRHAKSDWSLPYQHDAERGLSSRGRKQIKNLRKFFEKNPLDAQKIICSTALRAKLTYFWLAKNVQFAKIGVEFSSELYDFHMKNVEFFADFIRFFDDTLTNVVIIGHNPMFDNFISEYTHSMVHMPTASVVQIAFQSEKWSEITRGKLLSFFTDTV